MRKYNKMIRVDDELKHLLEKKKKYHRETYADVIKRYLKREVKV